MSGRRRDQPARAPYRRTARVNEVLREVLGDALERGAVSDDRLDLVTVTGVETASDLSRATVYLSSLDEISAGALAELRGELQRAIGRQVRMKRTPHLDFALDPGVAHGMRVEEILRRVHEHGETTPPTGAAGSEEPFRPPTPAERRHSRSNEAGTAPSRGIEPDGDA